MTRRTLPLAACLALLAISLLAAGPATTVPAAEASPASERAAIGRLYLAAFDRPADDDGLDYWYSAYNDGVRLNAIADYFVQSAEFRATYGQVDHEGFVDLIYANVLGRSADEPGLEYWVGLLGDGYSPGTILNGFAQSPEFIEATGPAALAPERVLMIGDSIFHGIRTIGIPVGTSQLTFMTKEGRQLDTLPGLLNTARENGSLASADVVVIHLGTNGWPAGSDALLSEQVEALAPKPVFVVNTEVARNWEGAANTGLAAVADAHPHVRLVDWNSEVADHPEWMQPDGVHPNIEGLRALAGLIERSLQQ